jgi:hypothetical protein
VAHEFDAALPWVILAALTDPVALTLAHDLARAIALLRRAAHKKAIEPPILDALKEQGENALILLNAAATDDYERDGFSWRVGESRIELFADSNRGLCKGLFDLLMNIGFQWKGIHTEVVPKPHHAAVYRLASVSNYCSSGSRSMQRLLIQREMSAAKQEKLLKWASRNNVDTVIFPLQVRSSALISTAKNYAFSIEQGGWELSRLLPRRYFLLDRSLFRMAYGKRDRWHNFCPTNPNTIKIIRKESQRLFQLFPEILVYHIWPDRGYEQQWCSCPTCRAFTPAEQNRIACDAVADVLQRIKPRASLSYYEQNTERNDIALRPNLFRIETLPEQAQSEPWILFYR